MESRPGGGGADGLGRFWGREDAARPGFFRTLRTERGRWRRRRRRRRRKRKRECSFCVRLGWSGGGGGGGGELLT